MIFAKIKTHMWIQFLITLGLDIGHLMQGYSLAWTAPILPKLENITESPFKHVLTGDEKSWVVSSIFVGVFGSYIAGSIANYIGRKLCLIIGGTLIFLSYAILAFAANVWMLYWGRFLCGFGITFLCIISLVYIGEMSSPEIRGILLTSTGMFNALGTLLVYSVGPFTTYSGVSYVVMTLAVLYTFICLFIPESPVYFVIKGKDEEAKASLINLGRSEDIERELNQMILNVKSLESKRFLWRQLLCIKSNRKTLFIMICLYFFQMNCGTIMMMFYVTTIFEDAGSSVEPHIGTIIIGATLFFGAVLSPILVEKSGRRLLLIVSSAGCCLAMTVLGVYFNLKKSNSSIVESFGWLPLAATMFAFISYAIGLAVIPNTLTGEMFGTNVRSLGSSVSFTIGLLTGFVSTVVSSYMMAYVGNDYAFWLFAVIDLIALIFTVFLVPETTGKTLTEINTMMNQ